MSVEFADASTREIEEDAARALVSQIIARSPGQRIDANAVLKANPGLCRYESLILDLAYEEFCQRTDAGERPEPNSFAQRFPEVEHSLLRVLEVHAYLDHHPDTMFKKPSTGWPQARDEIGGFTLVREIGRGGFSRVFLAREIDLGNREVVVKVSNLPNEEAARLGQLAHPNIVPVHSVRTLESGLTLICMPHLRAVTLGHVLDQLFAADQEPRHGREILQAIDRTGDDAAVEAGEESRRKTRVHWTLRSGSYAEAIVQLGAQVCDGLGHAHQQDVYHCDIKPSNVLLTPAGEALLFDFNLSLQRGTAAAIGGTLPYMAPEQLRCLMADDLSPQIDHRTDIFSLGVTIFQLLTGKMPFPVDEPGGDRKHAAMHLLERQQAGCQELDDVERLAGPQLRRLIERCLAFEPDERPASAEQVARELRNCLSPPRRLQRWYRAHRLAVWLAAASLVLIAIIVGIALALRPPLHIRAYRQGIASLEARDWVQAEEYLSRGIDANSEYPRARLARAWAYMKRATSDPDIDEFERNKLLELARKDLEICWSQAESPEAAASLGYCHARMGQFTYAVNYFEKADILGLTTPGVLNNMGYCLLKTRNIDKAIQPLTRALQMAPDFQAASHNLAVAEYSLSVQIESTANKEEKSDLLKEATAHHLQAIAHIRSSMQHIADAQRLGPSTGELEFNAARIHAHAYKLAGCDPDAERENLLRQVLISFKAALDLHWPADNLYNEVIGAAPQLRGSPQIQILLETRPSVGKALPAKLLVDVYPDVREHLSQAAR